MTVPITRILRGPIAIFFHFFERTGVAYSRTSKTGGGIIKI